MRRAATVFLTRRSAGEVEVYLVERSARLRFFGGYLALPGGVAEDGEELAACAVRELFEETGVLLPPVGRRVAAGRRPELRDALLRPEPDLGSWAAVVAGLDLDAPLTKLADLTTPEFAPLRYATRFFQAELPAGEQPSILPGELTGGAFWRPGEAVGAWVRGELLIAPPVLNLLRLFDRAGPAAFQDAVRAETARYDGGALQPVHFTPGVLLAALRAPTLPPATTTNCCIVGEGRLWVVDPAAPEEGEQQRLYDLLDDLVAEGRDLAGVLATHHHRDHVGAVVPLSRRYGLPVLAHPRTLDRLPPGFVEGRAIDDGDVLDLGPSPDGSGGWALRVLHTPGHDRGHLSFVETRYGAAIAGDLCSTVSTVIIDPPEGDLATYLDSLRRMLGEPITLLYPGHGPAARDGHGLLRGYLAHRCEREAALLAALAAVPRPVADLVREVYADVDPALHPLAARSLVAGLDKLAADGRARREAAGWRRP